MKERELTALQGVIVRQEIRGVIYPFPDGPVQGYEWRLLVQHPAIGSARPRQAWTPWVFGSDQSVEGMLAHWNSYMREAGHLAHSAPPGKTLQ